MSNNKKKTGGNFDLIFFAVSAVIVTIFGLNKGVLNPVNAALSFLLIALSPFIFKFLMKNKTEEKKEESAYEIIASLSEEELAKRVSSIYTGRGFALTPYESKEKGIHLICERKGVRNGEDFVERGAILILKTDEMFELEDYMKFKSDLSLFHCSQGMIVVSSRFSPEVTDLAKAEKIALRERAELREKFNL